MFRIRRHVSLKTKAKDMSIANQHTKAKVPSEICCCTVVERMVVQHLARKKVGPKTCLSCPQPLKHSGIVVVAQPDVHRVSMLFHRNSAKKAKRSNATFALSQVDDR